MIMKDNKQCNICAKQFLCKECTGLVKFSQIEGYGEVKKNVKD